MNRVLILFACLFFRCGSEDPIVQAPTITAAEPTNITITSASVEVTIDSSSPDQITLRGVVWGPSTNPTLSTLACKTEDGTGAGTFTASLSGLETKKYFVRPYAKIGNAEYYGNEVIVDILALVPIVTTTRAANIGLSGLDLLTTIVYTHTSPILEKGICWSTSGNVSITSGTKIVVAGASLTFNTAVNSLVPWTAYYVRGYVITALGTFYSTPSQLIIIPPIVYGTVTDHDGNNYRTIVIGTKEWMADNLKTTHYNDGVPIGAAASQDQFKSAAGGAFIAYNAEASNANTYGYLYNQYAVNTNKLCPTGWHVPSDAEWSQLVSSLGGMDYAGGRMKEITLWNSPNVNATNESGFSAIAGGSYCRVCLSNTGIFADKGTDGYWWSSAAGTFYYCTNDVATLRTKDAANINDGLSVRCVKN